jgi:hypothetical protein
MAWAILSWQHALLSSLPACPCACPVHVRRQTTATIYSLVGALNKIPVAVVGILAFHESTNPQNLASILIGLGAGIVFVMAKARGH